MAAVLFIPFSVDQPLNKITMKAQRKLKSLDYFISSSRYACVRCITLNLFLYKIMLYFDLSGWFDSFTFKRWFFDLFLLSVVDKDGPISCLETILVHISTLIWSNWPRKTVFTLSCSQQMQLIGSKYLTCLYLVQWNFMAQNFEKNDGKKHNKLVTFLKKYFLHLGN